MRRTGKLITSGFMLSVVLTGPVTVSGEQAVMPLQEEKQARQLGTYQDYLKLSNDIGTKRLENYAYLTISAINTMRPSFGTFETEGYVVKKYMCPLCPEGALCKPCQGSYIVISQQQTEFDFVGVMDKQMLVFIGEDANCDEGKKYRFLITMLDVKTTDQPINNARLIYSREINE